MREPSGCLWLCCLSDIQFYFGKTNDKEKLGEGNKKVCGEEGIW